MNLIKICIVKSFLRVLFVCDFVFISRFWTLIVLICLFFPVFCFETQYTHDMVTIIIRICSKIGFCICKLYGHSQQPSVSHCHISDKLRCSISPAKKGGPCFCINHHDLSTSTSNRKTYHTQRIGHYFDWGHPLSKELRLG